MNAAATTDGHPDVLDGIGLPTKRDEAWRYAPHRQLAELTFGPTADGSTVSARDLDGRIPELDGPRVVVVNGVVDRELSRFDPVAGAHLSSLADATGVDADVVRRHRGDVRIVDAYSALNAEYATDGVVLASTMECRSTCRST